MILNQKNYENYSYLQVNPGKGIGFALAYIALMVVYLSVVFGGFSGLADTVNNFAAAKQLGFWQEWCSSFPFYF